MDIEPIPDEVGPTPFPEEKLKEYIKACLRNCTVAVAEYMTADDADLVRAMRFQERFAGPARQMLAEVSTDPPRKKRFGMRAMRAFGDPMDDYENGDNIIEPPGMPNGFVGEAMALVREQIAEVKRTNDLSEARNAILVEKALGGTRINLRSRPPGAPSTWTKEQWEGMVEQHRTRKDLASACQLSGRTVKRLLDKEGITPPWAKTIVIEMERAGATADDGEYDEFDDSDKQMDLEEFTTNEQEVAV
jgi:hypothetical protein